MMKTKHISVYICLFLLCACSNENDELPGGGDNTPPAALRIEVSASDFTPAGTRSDAGNNTATRATDSGSATTFDTGDRIGITVLDNSGNVLSGNIPYIYNGNAWSFDTGNSEGKTAVYYDYKATTYVAYFPYSKEADGIAGANILTDLKAKFPPLPDQRTKDAYRASDLLVWSSGTSSAPLKKLEIQFTHAYASLSLSPSVKCKINGVETGYTPSSVGDVSFTIGTELLWAYRADDGSCRVIVSPQTTGARWFYSYKAKTYGGTMPSTALTVNNRYTLAPVLKDIGDYTLEKAQVGDFYCKSIDGSTGYLIPGDASLTDAQQAACIGIVYSTDVNRIGTAATKALQDKSVSPPHGLVMALTNASESCRWGDYGTDENSGGSSGQPFYANTDQLNKMYANVDGYGETRWIIDTYGSSGATLQDTYTAFYNAKRYGTAESNTEKYAAPSNTTGWFIPGMGQWWDILSNLGGVNLSDYQSSQESYKNIDDVGQIAVDNMNTYLQKIGGATKFGLNTYFWSSSECNGYRACDVNFYYDGGLRLGWPYKGDSYDRVRCSFAF